jgi:hypothetical protein
LIRDPYNLNNPILKEYLYKTLLPKGKYLKQILNGILGKDNTCGSRVKMILSWDGLK